MKAQSRYIIRTRGSPVFCGRRKLHGFRRRERADLCRSGISRIPSLATSVYRWAFVRKALLESCALLGFYDLLPHLTAPPDNQNQSLGSYCPNRYNFQEKCAVLPKLPGSLETKYTREPVDRTRATPAKGHLRGPRSVLLGP